MSKKTITIFLILVFLSSFSVTYAKNIDDSVFYLEGALIKGTRPEVFLLRFQKRHWIKTPEIFSSLGYKWEDVIELKDNELNQCALGIVIASFKDLDKLNRQNIGGETKEEIIELKEPTIRIGIYGSQNREVFQIIANGPYEVYKDNQFLTIKNKGEAFETIINHRVVFNFVAKTKDTIFEVKNYRLRGNLELKYSPKSKLVWLINELDLEDYLRGVAETEDSYPIESLKSLAVAARSYALFHLENKGKYPEEPFHLRSWAYDQLYQGYGFEIKASNFIKAIESTKGIIATLPSVSGTNLDKPILGVYSLDSGGITRNACEAWGNNFCNGEYNYLKGGIRDLSGTVHNYLDIKNSHGVGISVVGANELANKGKNYQEILKYYYPGIEIRSRF